MIVYRRGLPATIVDAAMRDGRVVADAEALAASTGIATRVTGMVSVRDFVAGRYETTWKAETSRAYLVEKSGATF